MVSFRESSVDAPTAIDLLREYFDYRSATFPEALRGYRAVSPSAADFTPPTGVFLIVEGANLAGDAADVGCGGARRIPTEEQGRVRFEIKHLWIRPHMRGSGLGRLLLGELERRARELGATEVVLDTNASLIAAGALYAASGYTPIAPYNDNPNATHWYRKALDELATPSGETGAGG